MRVSAVAVMCLLAACDDSPSSTTSDVADVTTPADTTLADTTPDVDTTPSERAQLEAGEALFWRAMAGEVELRQDALDALAAGLETLPDDPRGNLVYGMALLSAVAEDGNFAAALTAIPVLEHAIEVTPDDLRIPGWLGTVKVPMAAALGDAEGLTAACDALIAAADAYPDFNNVNLAIAFAKLPLDTPYPQMAVDRLEAIADCADGDICGNTARAPHNVEGVTMLYGDVHARIGDTDAARAYYQAALASPTAAAWKYRARAQAMLDDLDARVALYLDADPKNDPLFFAEGETSCVGCHAP